MSNMYSKIQKGSGVYICSICGKKTRDTGHGEGSVGICRDCYIEQEEYNQSLDIDEENRNS